jgi:DNA helicase HerA-like ATPase
VGLRIPIPGRAGSETAAETCRQIFEKIAREGRKFGLGLVLASQRPSELSATVLAKCNTFLLHRIVNDEDQRLLVRRLMPDSLMALLNELPVVPSQEAIILGWAVPTRCLPSRIHRAPPTNLIWFIDT